MQVAKFNIKGVKLRIPDEHLSPPLIKALEAGHYEWNESAALQKHLVRGDRVLDLGAGAGFVSALSARLVGAGNVTAVEASPDMLAVLRRNLNANGAGETRVLHGAVVADSFAADSVRFKVAAGFWASAISQQDGVRDVEVPALKFSALVQKLQPSVVIMDIEGGEVDICQQDWPACVRLMIMEIHTNRYAPATVKAMFDGLSRTGFTYMPWGTRGEVVVQQRVRDEP